MAQEEDAVRVDVERSVGLALKQATAALRAAMEEVLRPAGLSVAQYACLEQLRAAPGVSAAGLARRTFVTRQSAHALLAGLAARGLLERPEQAPAGRALPTRLTAAGEHLLAGSSRAVAAVEARMLRGLHESTGGGAEELRAALLACAAALQP